MPTVEQSIDLKVPTRIAYDQWTQFEDFPRFMKDVEKVEQGDGRTVRWEIKVGGVKEQFTTRISEQIPDKRIAWTSVEGIDNAGCVTFHRLSDSSSRVMVQIVYQPEGVVERVAGALGLLEQRVKANLERFRDFIEERRSPTGAWRGVIPSPDEAETPATETTRSGARSS